MRNVTLKVTSTRSCYDTHTYLYEDIFILPLICLPYQLHHHVIINEVAVLDKNNKGCPHCQVVVPASASLPERPDRSVMLPELVSLGHICMFTRRRHLKRKTIKKSFPICTISKQVETSRLSSYTSPHYTTPLVSKA